LGIEIFAIGYDSVETNQSWAEDQSFQYEVWTDTDRTLALHYGAASSTEQPYPSRITRLLDTDGQLLLEYDSVNFLSGPQDVLEDCELLFGAEE
jgi:peroxiredoxin